MSLTEADKQWIATLVTSQIERSEERVASRMEQVAARIEHVETALLTEFHKWASPMEMRVKSHSMVLRTLDMEIDSINERVTKLEEK